MKDNIKLYLAPMAGITDVAARELCTKQGAQLTFSEMVSAKGLEYKNSKTQDLLVIGEEEKNVGIQLFGKEPDILANAAAFLCDTLPEKLRVIDINMGCPAPKIVKNGEGCALMNEHKLASDIISAVKKAASVPVSVKFRMGMNENSICAVDFAKMAEDAGADCVTIHGRTREQYYSGKANWDIIRSVREAVGIKVVGNGDIFCAQDAKNMLDQTGCDAVMVARGSQGNPFIFAQITELLREGKVKTYPSDEERIKMCLKQAKTAIKYKAEYIAIREMRTHAQHYTKGMVGGAKLRTELVKVQTYNELENILLEYLQK